MYRITYVIDLFKGDHDRNLSHKTLDILLGALSCVDEAFLREHPETPLLYKSGVRYEEEPVGQEDWQDIPTTLKLGIGDCVPLSTLVMFEDYSLVPLSLVRPGDRIMGDGDVVTVVEAAMTGQKKILAFDLSNHKTLRCSPEHRLFLHDESEICAKDVKTGDRLLSPRTSFTQGPDGYAAERFAPFHVVQGIREEPEEMCADITTSSGRFYLPESDVVVHNCEDLACWRAAELRVRYGVDAWPTFIWKLRPNGGYLYHIQVKYPDGRIEDPSRALGMR